MRGVFALCGSSGGSQSPDIQVDKQIGFVLTEFRVLVVGHSHIVALRKAGEMLPPAFGLSFEFINLNAREAASAASVSGNAQGNPVIEDIESFQPDVIASCVGGNAHTIFGLLEHPSPFDFIHPDDEDHAVDSTRQILPYTVIRSALEAGMTEELKTLALLRRDHNRPVFHLESPPGNPSEQHIQQYPGAFKALMSERGITPASIRHKLWQVNSLIVRESCEKNGIRFVAVPREVQDTQGMLVEQAWNPDPTHANPWYGGRILEQLKRIVPGVLQ